MVGVHRGIIVTIIALGAFCLGYATSSLVRSVSDSLNRPVGSPGEIEGQFLRFTHIANNTRAYIAAHDGELPADLYTAMVDPSYVDVQLQKALKEYVEANCHAMTRALSKAEEEANRVTAFRYLVFHVGTSFTVPLYHLDEVPLRLNPDLAKNPRECLFWLSRDDTKSTWQFNMDGTITIQPWDAGAAKEPEPWWQRWSCRFRAAGYPYWTTPEMKAEWYRQNKHKLVWDEAERMYVVRKPSAATAESKPAEGN